MITALIFLQALAGQSVQPPESILLRYKFHPGESRTYKAALNMNVVSNIGGKKLPTDISLSSEAKETVKALSSAGTAEVIANLLESHVDVGSKGDAEVPSVTNFKKASSFKLSPRGIVSDTTLPGMNAGLAPFLADGFTTSLQQMVGPFPDESVTEGSHWTEHEVFLGVNFEAAVSLEKLVTEGSHSVAYLAANADIDLSKLKDNSGFANRGTIKGSINYSFDVTAGRLLTMRAEMHIDAHISESASPAQEDELQGTMTMRVNLVDMSG